MYGSRANNSQLSVVFDLNDNRGTLGMRRTAGVGTDALLRSFNKMGKKNRRLARLLIVPTPFATGLAGLVNESHRRSLSEVLHEAAGISGHINKLKSYMYTWGYSPKYSSTSACFLRANNTPSSSSLVGSDGGIRSSGDKNPR